MTTPPVWNSCQGHFEFMPQLVSLRICSLAQTSFVSFIKSKKHFETVATFIFLQMSFSLYPRAAEDGRRLDPGQRTPEKDTDRRELRAPHTSLLRGQSQGQGAPQLPTGGPGHSTALPAPPTPTRCPFPSVFPSPPPRRSRLISNVRALISDPGKIGLYSLGVISAAPGAFQRQQFRNQRTGSGALPRARLGWAGAGTDGGCRALTPGRGRVQATRESRSCGFCAFAHPSFQPFLLPLGSVLVAMEMVGPRGSLKVTHKGGSISIQG